jgi:hypothetical protein
MFAKMKSLILVVAVMVVAIVLPISSQDPIASRMNEAKKAALDSWKRFLAQQFKLGQREDEVEKVMAGKFRDRGKVPHGGTGAYSVVYLIDDYHQVSFGFDLHSELTLLPVTTARKPWLRLPDGTIVESDR